MQWIYSQQKTLPVQQESLTSSLLSALGPTSAIRKAVSKLFRQIPTNILLLCNLERPFLRAKPKLQLRRITRTSRARSPRPWHKRSSNFCSYTLDLSSSRNFRDGDGADIGSSVLNLPTNQKILMMLFYQGDKKILHYVKMECALKYFSMKFSYLQVHKSKFAAIIGTCLLVD